MMSIARSVSVSHLATAVVGSLFAIAGLWLPWVRNLPVGYRNGRPMYTSEGPPGAETGIGASGFFDWLVLLLLALAIAHLVVVRYRHHRPIYGWAATGGYLLVVIVIGVVGELQWIHLILAGPFVALSFVSSYFDWRPLLVVRLVGVSLLSTAAIYGYEYLTVERYASAPGWFVFSLGGLLLLFVGIHQRVPRLRDYSPGA